MLDLVKVEFTVEAGYWKVGKLKTLVSEIDNHYARLKSETGQRLNFECSKQPWQSNLVVTVEGPKEAVGDFLRRIRPTADKLGLKGVPEHWHELP